MSCNSEDSAPLTETVANKTEETVTEMPLTPTSPIYTTPVPTSVPTSIPTNTTTPPYTQDITPSVTPDTSPLPSAEPTFEDDNVTEYKFKEHVPDEKVICFTFDDGPSLNTGKIVDKLEGTGDKVTFFVVGDRFRSSVWSSGTKKAIEQGHEIGFHSFDHLGYYTDLTDEELKEQIDETNKKIEALGGKPVRVIRPVGGYLDFEKNYGYPCILWSVDPYDWKFSSYISSGEMSYDDAVKELADLIVSKATNGSVILLHDLYSCSVDAFCLAYDTLKAEGYKFVTVSEMFGIEGKDASGYTFRSTSVAYYLGERCS